MNPIIPTVGVGAHVFLACLNLPTFNVGFAFNAGFAAFWFLTFFRVLARSPQETSHD